MRVGHPESRSDLAPFFRGWDPGLNPQHLIIRTSHPGLETRTHKFINCATVIWYTKCQSTVDTSTFSSESIALKTWMKHIVAIIPKLIMFEIPI